MLKMHKPNVTIKHEDEFNEFEESFVIEPLERGFGHTLGNSIRRVLLSSIEGVGITKIKIENVSHEFSTVEGLKEDVLEFIANLKNIVFKMDVDGPVEMKLKKNSQGEIKASDIKLPSEVEVITPDVYIGTLTDKGKIDMTIVLEKSKGYRPSDENKIDGDPIGFIPFDTIFSPVRRVSFKVENTRVGQVTNYEKLIIDIKTNGSIKPEDALSQGSKIINDYMALLIDLSATGSKDPIFEESPAIEPNIIGPKTIDELELSVRAFNCLKRENIDTVEKLLNYKEEELLQIRNFGQKSIQEVKDKVKELGYTFKK